MSDLKPSSKNNPCPVCDRTKDGDCRIMDNGVVLCHTHHEKAFGAEVNGYRFVQRNKDERTGLWKPSEQWIEQTKQPSYYHQKKRWTYQNRQGEDILAYERLGDKKWQTSLTSDPISVVRSQVVPYRFHDAHKAIEMARADGVTPTVYVVEGEKCVDAIWNVGLPAVTFSGGANGFKPDIDSGHFDDDVLLILTPDRDLPGIEYMQTIAKNYSENPKSWLRCFPDEPLLWNGSCPPSNGKDVADWLQGVPESSARQILLDATTNEPITQSCKSSTVETLIDQLLGYELERDLDNICRTRKEITARFGIQRSGIDEQIQRALVRRLNPSVQEGAKKRRSAVRRASKPASTHLLDGFIPRASLAMTDGPSGAGKTLFEIEKCIALTEGRNCFDREKGGKPESVLFIATDSGASDFFKGLDNLGYSDHYAVQQAEIEPGEPGYDPEAACFYRWAESPEDGIERWTATVSGLVQLADFAKEKHLQYIVIDSAKTTFDHYADNPLVATYLVTLRSIICDISGATVCIINHDGVNAGANAGAKTWVENVSFRTRLERVEDDFGNREATSAQIKKDRSGNQERKFKYVLNQDEERFELVEGYESVGTCEAEIGQILWNSYLKGKKHLKTKSIQAELTSKGLASSTISNTLSQHQASAVFQKRGRGQYELTVKEKARRDEASFY